MDTDVFQQPTDGLCRSQGTLPELCHSEYTEWLKSDRESVGLRLRYPFLKSYMERAWDEEEVSIGDFLSFYQNPPLPASEGVFLSPFLSIF